MYLIQLLLPLCTNEGQLLPKSIFEQVSTQLTEKFGGLTSFVRSPAVGLWKDDREKTVKDDIILYEVMTDTLDTRWWQTYRQQVCALFQQEELIIRASPVQLL